RAWQVRGGRHRDLWSAVKFDFSSAVIVRPLGVLQRGGRALPPSISMSRCGSCFRTRSTTRCLRRCSSTPPAGLFAAAPPAGCAAISVRAGVGAHAAAGLTSQAAERVYRSAGATTTVETGLVVARDAWLEWLPNETILFDRARLTRRLAITLGAGARCLAAEL